MYSFVNDYSHGAHPNILDALRETNLIQTPGYGEDTYCMFASDRMKELTHNSNIDVHFFCGGTQTNLVFIASVLKSYEAIISVDSAHINVHETGAIENVGHKILTRPHVDGKLTACMIEDVLKEHSNYHRVKPKLVFISQSTEYGTAYTYDELKELYHCCKSHGLYLYIDGARLVSTLALEDAPSLQQIASLCDAFYLGGTKAGCLFGECLVIINDEMKPDFKYSMKQHGALLAKGRLLGLQFLTLLSNDLYLEIAMYQNRLADKMREEILNAGYEFYVESNTNQLFPIFPSNVIERLETEFMFHVMETFHDGSKCLRIITSWATIPHKVERFIELMNNT